MEFDLRIYDATVIPAMIFILWILEQIGAPRKLLPLFSLALGIAAGMFFVDTGPEGFVAGTLLAAAAVGFHSGTKNTKEYFLKED